jgi:hypothetical protein
MPFKYLLVSVLLIIAKNGFSQTSKKSVTAKFTNEKIIIDGKLNEAIWKNTDIATDFVYLFPENGKDVPKNLDTQVKVLYDNTAIYIGAYLKDDEPNKITKELTQRDNFATAEHFGALINGFNDGQQDFRFYVSSAGVQIDVLHTDNDGEDDTWNAIWESSVKIVKVNLLNALKVSGRTKGGLGIGILNAITEKTNAKIKDSTTQETSEQTLEPLANYNILVLDQRFNQNSSVTLINTNVTRNGTFRDANVTGALFDLNTKANTYNLSGDFKYSYINDFFDLENKKGINTSIYAAETSGKFRYGGGAKYVSTNWDNNDLGINFQTHYHAVYSNASFRILKPTKFFNSFSIYNNIYTEFDNRTGRVQSASINLNNNFTTKKNDYFNYGFSSTPIKTYDFYEARSFNQSKFLTIPKSINFFTYISTNYTRKFAIDFNPSYGFHDQYKRVNYGILIIPRYRFSDKISLIYALNFSRQNNNIGYIDSDPITDEVFIARRNRITYINTIIGKYTLNSDMNLALSVRHY